MRHYDSFGSKYFNKDLHVHGLRQEIINLLTEVSALGGYAVLDVTHAEALGSVAQRLIRLGVHAAPRLMAWCVVGIYNPEGDFRPGDEVVWSAHHTEAAARAWLPFWERKFARRIERGDTYEVKWHPTDLIHLCTPEARPEDRGRYWDE